MPVFKFVLSDGKKSYQIEKDQRDAPVLEKKIGEVIAGSFLGLDGYELRITGGTDRDGFPMRKDVEGITKKRLILTDGIGFHTHHGIRKRKIIRGNTISAETAQINCVVTKRGAKSVEDALGIAPKEATEREGA